MKAVYTIPMLELKPLIIDAIKRKYHIIGDIDNVYIICHNCKSNENQTKTMDDNEYNGFDVNISSEE